jgi:hypothetical protein
MLNTYKVLKQNKQPNLEENEDRLVFVQQGGGDGVKCWHCDEKGHTKATYPKLKEIEEGVQNLNAEETPEPEEEPRFDPKTGQQLLNMHGLTLLGNGRSEADPRYPQA